MATTTDKYVLDAQLNASGAVRSANSLTGSLTKLAKKVGIVYLSMKALRKSIDLIGNSLQDASKMEQWNISFEVMLGSAEKAKILMEEISDFAKTTPFILPDVVSNTKMLMAMNIESENVIDTMRMLGDISAGTGTNLSRLALNLGQVASLGRLSGREIRDFAMAGLDVLKPLEKILGKTASELKEMTSKGEISFNMVMQSLKAMTSEGGKFDNLMGRLVNTLPAQISNLKDQFFRLSVTFGKELLPVAIDFVKQMKIIADDTKTKETLRSLAESMSTISIKTLEGINNLSTYKEEIRTFIKVSSVGFQTVGAVFRVITDAFQTFGMASAYLATQIQNVYMYIEQVGDGIERIATDTFETVVSGFASSMKEMGADAWAGDWTSLFNKIGEIADDVGDDFTNGFDNMGKATEKFNHDAEINNKAFAESMKIIWESFGKDTKKIADTILGTNKKIQDSTKETITDMLKMKMIWDKPTTGDDELEDSTFIPLDEERENIKLYYDELRKVQNFIDSSLTSAVTGFYDQLLSGKNTIEDWGNFFLSMLKRIIAQMLVMQTLYAINPLMGGAANIFGSLFGGGGSTLSTGAVSAGAGAITNNDGLERLAEVLSNQSINVNINPNAFIQSADTRILSQQNEIGTIQRGITSL